MELGFEEKSPEVPASTKRLEAEHIFDRRTGLPHHELLRYHFEHGDLLKVDAAVRIIREGAELLRAEPKYVEVDEPITVCGNLQGQFKNLLKLIKIGDQTTDTKYIFIVNYEDPGCFGIEIVLYLWTLKMNYPSTFYLLRGNQKCAGYTNDSNFEEECRSKYTFQFYKDCKTAFNCLPLGAVVNNGLFCVHGGLPPKISTLEEMNQPKTVEKNSIVSISKDDVTDSNINERKKSPQKVDKKATASIDSAKTVTHSSSKEKKAEVSDTKSNDEADIEKYYFRGDHWWRHCEIPQKERCAKENCSFEPDTHRKHYEPKRNLSLVEKKILVKYLILRDAITRAKGRDIYLNMIQDGYLTHRPWETLRTCMRRTILKEVGAYNLDPYYLNQFKELMDSRPMTDEESD